MSPASLQSEQVGEELAYALEVQKQRGRAGFPVIPLSLDGTGLGVLRRLFGEEPVCVPVSSAPGGIDAAVDAILAALGKRLPADVEPTPQRIPEPLEELVLHVTDLEIHEEDGEPRASARARLVHQPATPGQPEVTTPRSWRFEAPLGPIEAGGCAGTWRGTPSGPAAPFAPAPARWRRAWCGGGVFCTRAPSRPLHRERHARVGADRRPRGPPLLGLRRCGTGCLRLGRRGGRGPGSGHGAARPPLGATPRRRPLSLPGRQAHPGPPPPAEHAGAGRRGRRPAHPHPAGDRAARGRRVPLLRPPGERTAAGGGDGKAAGPRPHPHSRSAHLLRAARRARPRAKAREPYHVVHFDGHGHYDRRAGRGGLCFEDPGDVGMLEKRRHLTVYTDELGPLLLDHRVPLVFLEACQTAQGEKAAGSVASALLEVGVASVVAMTHSVLVETSRRFVEAFDATLARGGRVGDATLEGQRRLKDDRSRAWFFGEGELRMEDWFVPVLFREREDPQLFRTTPSRQTRKDFARGLAVRLGNVPAEPETGFVGRSRELLALQRLLRHGRYAVVRGQGGEGKTALAAELAR